MDKARCRIHQDYPHYKNKPDDVRCKLCWKCLFFPVVILSKKVINRSLNGVSNTQGKPINIAGHRTDNDVVQTSVRQSLLWETQKPQK